MSVESLNLDTARTWSARTVSEQFKQTVEKFGEKIALRTMTSQVDPLTNQIKASAEYTWKDYDRSARSFAKSLIAHKVKRTDAVTIQGSNSAPWMFANVGTILAGGVTAGVYATNKSDLCEHVVANCDAKVIVVEDEQQLQKYKNVKSTALKCFVVWNRTKEIIQSDYAAPVYSWDEFIKKGEDVPEEKVEKRIKKQTPDQACSIIYTSGTTGKPKGAVLTHDNLTWTAAVAGRCFGMHDKHQGVSYLPLSHVAAQQLDCMVPITCGSTVDIAPNDALKGNNLKQYIVATRPTYFLAVPRVWEKFKEGIEAKVKEASFLKQQLFKVSSWIGKKIGPDLHFLTRKKKSSSLTLLERIRYAFSSSIMFLLGKIIYTPIKKAMGLDRCELAVNGAGALNPEVVRFFAGLNIHIVDLFGLSETSGPTTAPNQNGSIEGSCGGRLPGVEVKIGDPDENGEGEILVKGRNVFKEYLNNQAATQEVIDNGGYFHTGDRGKLDADGNLFITGRIKELIKTSGGENIPPLRIEDKIKSELPIVSQAVVIGEGKNYLTCLLTLQTELDIEGNPTTKLAPAVIQKLRTLGSKATTLQEAAIDQIAQDFLMAGIKRANMQADSQAQVIQKMTMLPEDFSVANGMMTATLKLKRYAITKKYENQINQMYA